MPKTRIKFLNPDALDHIRSISNDIIEYYISLTPAGLLLICEPYVNVIYSYPIQFSRQLLDLANDHWGTVEFDGYDTVSWGKDEETILCSANSDLSDQECPVCYESFNNTSNMVATCGHGACMSCLKKMAEKNLNTCPICRSESFKWLIAYVCY